MYNGCDNCSGCGYDAVSDSYSAGCSENDMPNQMYNTAKADELGMGMTYTPVSKDDFEANKEEYKNLDEEQMQKPEEKNPEEERINFDKIVDELAEQRRMQQEEQQQQEEQVVEEESDSE